MNMLSQDCPARHMMFGAWKTLFLEGFVDQEKLKALDILVKKHIFGLHDLVSILDKNEGKLVPEVWWSNGAQELDKNLIMFSSDPRGATLVLERVRRSGKNLEIFTAQDGFCIFSDGKELARAETLPVAICLAALLLLKGIPFHMN